MANGATIEFIKGRLPFEGLDNDGLWCNPNKGRNADGWRNKYIVSGQKSKIRPGQFDSMLVIFGDAKK
jgi:hypothetical protein